MARQQIGLVGLDVMGQNLVLNMESRGYAVAGYNRTTEKMTRFIAARCQGKNVAGYAKIEDFCAALVRPRKVVLMVKAGAPVDAVIEQLRPHLGPGDLLIDAGNSHFADTERRLAALQKDGLLYIGTGVSGGEEGALKGPSIMPGGSEAAYALVKDIFEKIAAQVDGPCCAYIGPRGAGHYVKMVHNGIEYGIMECISEVYDLLKTVLGLKAPALAKIFAAWTAAELGGYLMDITADILTRKDADTKKPLVDVILDKAGQKGTGKWTSQNALDLGVAVPTIDMAVEGRILSAFKEERVAAAKVLKGPRPRAGIARARLVKALRDGLYVSVIACYAQGFALLKEASREYQYDLKLPEVARIWKGGCIIRSKLLDPITEAYRARPDLANLLVAPFFAKIVKAKAHGLRLAVTAAVKAGVPVLGLGSALSYIDAYRRPRMPADLTQAQRDYFGAHTYERLDKPGTFHTEWIERPC